MAGPRTWIPVDWGAKTQGVTARSTPDAELAALDYATFMSCIPLQLVMEKILKRAVRANGHEDNEPALLAVRKGYSKRLAYLPKTQRVQISALNEYWTGRDSEDPTVQPEDHVNRLFKVASLKQRADLLTKSLSPDHHRSAFELAGMGVGRKG